MGVMRMKLVQKALVLAIASWIGCSCSLVFLELLRTLFAPRRYVVVLPILFGATLAITDVLCALFIRRVREHSQMVLVGLIQGSAVPWVCNLIWDLIYWDRPVAIYKLYLCALFVSMVLLACAYFIVSGDLLGKAN